MDGRDAAPLALRQQRRPKPRAALRVARVAVGAVTARAAVRSIGRRVGARLTAALEAVLAPRVVQRETLTAAPARWSSLTLEADLFSQAAQRLIGSTLTALGEN